MVFEDLIQAISAFLGLDESNSDWRAVPPAPVEQFLFSRRAHLYEYELISAWGDLERLLGPEDPRFPVFHKVLRDNDDDPNAYEKRYNTRVELLAPLAMTLDKYAVQAIAAEAPNSIPEFWYEEYLQANVVDPVGREQFHQERPLLVHALKKASSNFYLNLSSAWRRIARDWNDIGSVFGKELLELTKIRSTGSDFHAGGKQVLILTFMTWGGEMKIVYKPTDLDIDFRIVGNTEGPVRRILALGSEEKSFLELVNENAPRSHHLATYTIFPAATTTNVKSALEGAYGYLEFIEYNSNVDEEHRPSFFFQMGQLTAIACALSMKDVHADNVILRDGKPHLIDLEICLTEKNTSLVSTVIKDALLHDYVSQEYTGWDGGQKGIDVHSNNVIRGDNRRMVSLVDGNDYAPALLRGYSSMLEWLMANSQKTKSWLAQRNQTIVRNIPFDTSFFANKLRIFYANQKETLVNRRDATLAELDRDRGDFRVSEEMWEVDKDEWSLPTFAVLHSVVRDCENLDIASFYAQPGGAELYNSKGDVVQPTLRRDTYFPMAPTVQIDIQLGEEFLRKRYTCAIADLSALLPDCENALVGAANSYIL